MPDSDLFKSLPPKEPGVISMLYWGTYHGDIQSAFHLDDAQGMDFFHITDPQERAWIQKIGWARKDPPSADPLGVLAKEWSKEFFDAYLVDEFLQIWTAEQIPGTEPLSTPLPQGLVPFMYWVRHQAALNKAFHDNPNLVMRRFGLADGARSLILGIDALHDKPAGREPSKGLAKALFENHLVDEFLRTQYPFFW